MYRNVYLPILLYAKYNIARKKASSLFSCRSTCSLASCYLGRLGGHPELGGSRFAGVWHPVAEEGWEGTTSLEVAELPPTTGYGGGMENPEIHDIVVYPNLNCFPECLIYDSLII